MSLLFWGQSFSWVSAVLFELASLLSGIDLPVGSLIVRLDVRASLPVWFLICCLGVCLPVGKAFS